jgi:hypothetical protein
VQDFHLHYRYSYRHSHLYTLHHSSPYGFYAEYNALLPRALLHIRCFGLKLIPDHLRRYSTRPVSYYALFKWWLLLSQHPGCLGRITSSRTKLYFGTLAGDLGCFHFDDEHYRSPTHSRDSLYGIRSLIGMSSRVGPHSHSVALPP